MMPFYNLCLLLAVILILQEEARWLQSVGDPICLNAASFGVLLHA